MIVAFQGSLRPAPGQHSTIWDVEDRFLDAYARLGDGPELLVFNAAWGGRSAVVPRLPGPASLRREALRAPTRLLRAADRTGLLDVRARWLRARGAALLHVPEQIYLAPPRFPTVVTYHDLIPELFPHWSSPEVVWALRKNAERAAHFIAISENTKKDLVRLYGVSSDAVSVVPYGLDHGVFRPQEIERVTALRRGKGLPERYVLCMGPFGHRKNFGPVLDAFPAWRESAPSLGLVFVGGPTPYRAELEEAVRRCRLAPCVFAGEVSDAGTLALFYAGAEVLVYSSVYEGFGKPVLEAMACGAPAAVSDATSLPEVAGPAGLLFDPSDGRALSEAVLSVLRSGERRRELSERGLAWARRFTWDENARRTRQVYQRVAEGLR